MIRSHKNDKNQNQIKERKYIDSLLFLIRFIIKFNFVKSPQKFDKYFFRIIIDVVSNIFNSFPIRMSNLKKIVSMSAVAMLGVTNLLTPFSFADAATWYDALTDDDLKQHALRFIMPNKDVYLYAVTEANHYFVRYNGNTHTSWNMPDSEFIYDQEWELSGNVFKKTWYTFSGWNTQPNGNGTSYVNKAKVLNWTTENNDIVNIHAQWKVNRYNITYDLNDDSGTSSWSHSLTPSSLAYDETWNIANPTRTWYWFSGWDITNMDSESHIVWWEASNASSATGVMGTEFKNLNATDGATVKFAAKWTRNPNTKYKVEHYLETLTTGQYPSTAEDTDNLTGPTDTTVTPETKTYIWFEPNAVNTPTSGNIDSDGNKVFRYEYIRKSFNLTLNAGRWIALVKGAGTVTAEKSSTTSATISFKYDEPVTLNFTLKTWYQNGAWTGYSGAASSFNMPASHQTKTANATPIVYTINADPKWGTVSPANPTSYTVESGDITLTNPTRLNSTFAWWTGWIVGWEQLSSATETVKIASGSIWNRKYTATWTCHSWYYLSNDTTKCIPNSNTEYTVRHYKQDLDWTYNVTPESVTQTWTTDDHVDPRPKNYVWFEVVTPLNTEPTINWNGTTVVDVQYRRLSYAWTIQNPTWVEASSITASAAGAHPTWTEWTYKYDDTVTISATLAPGYIFNGWTVEDASGHTVTVTNPTSLTNATFIMPASSVIITPDVTKIGYTITYNLNSGSVTTANPTSYNVETTTFTLNNPTRLNSTFVWWSGWIVGQTPTTQSTVTIAKWSVWNRSYEAIWSCHTWYHAEWNSCVANEYQGKVDYHDGEHWASETISFTYDQVTNLPNPEQSWYNFVWWRITWMSGWVEHIIGTLPVTGDTVDSTKATEFMNLSTEQWMTDITFTAIWEARNDTLYKVYHYYQNTGDNKYVLSGTAVEYSWTTDEGIDLNRIMEKTFGFHNHAGVWTYWAYTWWNVNGPAWAAKTQITIDKHGNTVIYFYYDRNVRNVYLSGDVNIATLSGSGAYKYGADVTATATAKTWYHFVRWEKRNSSWWTWS